MKNYVTPGKVPFTSNDFFIIRQSIQNLTEHRDMFFMRFRQTKSFLLNEYNDVIADSCVLFPDQLPFYYDVSIHSLLSIIRRLKMLNNFCVAGSDKSCLQMSSILSDAIMAFDTVLRRTYDE